jgi:acetolactate synthase-1/2/3 large subunit
MGPVVIALDGHLQEQELGDSPPPIPPMPRNLPPQGDVGGLREAARMLVEAERPVIVADRMARTPEGVKRLVELAEVLQAPVVDRGGRMNFPNTHYLSQRSGLVGQADVILGLELLDFWGTIQRMHDLPHRQVSRVAPEDVKLIHLGVNELFIKSNYQYFQRYQPVNLSINGDAEASLPSLIEEVRRLLTAERRSQLDSREAGFRQAHADSRARARQGAVYAWNASPVSTDRVVMEVWQQIKDRDWSLVSDHLAGLPRTLWNMDQHYRYIGGSAGRGQGYGAPAAVGAALANREHGRFTVNFQADGDLMYAPGVLWTAAHHKIPLLSVMHNNRAYHQEVMHIQRIGNRRQRGANGQAKIGNTFEDPYINYAGLAKDMGMWSAGPITDPDDLAAALKRAVDVVDQGEPALVDVVCQPR